MRALNSCSVILLLLVTLNPVHSQSVQKIPRRVYFDTQGSVTRASPEQALLAEGAEELLYHTISSHQAIVRVDDKRDAHNTVTIEFRVSENTLLIQVTLLEEKATILREEHGLSSDKPDVEGYVRFISETSRIFASHLELIEPEIQVVDVSEEARLSEIIEETEYSDLLNKSYEVTLWSGSLTQVYHDPLREDPELMENRFSVLPLFLDSTWYVSRNTGVFLSLFFEYGDFFSYGTIRSEGIEGEEGEDIRKALSKNLYLLPGIGICYRTLDRIAAQFNMGLYWGALRVEGIDRVPGLVDAGESLWMDYSFFSLGSALVWNPHPKVAVKLRMNFNLDIRQLIFSNRISYSFSHNGLFFQLLSLGFSYRP